MEERQPLASTSRGSSRGLRKGSRGRQTASSRRSLQLHKPKVPAARPVSPASKQVQKGVADALDELNPERAEKFKSMASAAVCISVRKQQSSTSWPPQRLATSLSTNPRLIRTFVQSVLVGRSHYGEGDSGLGRRRDREKVARWRYRVHCSAPHCRVGTAAPVAQFVQWEGFIELVNGSARSIFTKNVLIEMWMDVELTVCTNRAAALEMSSRFGAGKIEHLAVRLLWSQEVVRSKVLTVVKIKGEAN